MTGNETHHGKICLAEKGRQMLQDIARNADAVEQIARICQGRDVQTLIVVPHFNDKEKFAEVVQEILLLRKCLESLEAQTDEEGKLERRFVAVVVNDASPVYIDDYEHRQLFLNTLKAPAKEIDLVVVEVQENKGAGVARNIGIDLAVAANIPTVTFLEHSDRADPRRVAMTIKAFEDESTSMLYSPVILVDNEGTPYRWREVDPATKAFLAMIKDCQPGGVNAWKEMYETYRYITPPTAVAVRTEVAARYPFDRRQYSELVALPQWMASGGRLAYVDEISAFSRIIPLPARPEPFSSQERFEPVAYAWADLCGLRAAINAAIERGMINREEIIQILTAYRMREANLMPRPNDHEANEATRFDGREDIAHTLDHLLERAIKRAYSGEYPFDDSMTLESFLMSVNNTANVLELEDTSMPESVRSDMTIRTREGQVEYTVLRAEIGLNPGYDYPMR